MTDAITTLSAAGSGGVGPGYLFLPPAGGTRRAFDPLADAAIGSVVRGVEYPGHGERLGETPAGTIGELADGLASEVAGRFGAAWFSQTVLLGIGMGAFVALELAQRIRVAPAALIVVDACAPQRRTPHKNARADAAAMGRVFGRTGLTPVAGYRDAPERWEYALDLLLGDLQVLNAYRGPSRVKVSCPISALRGSDDQAFASGDDATGAWRVWTSGPFVGRVVPGGHLGVLDPGRETEFWARIHRLEALFADAETDVA
jgi:surfactin synthase thioesterase subunit